MRLLNFPNPLTPAQLTAAYGKKLALCPKHIRPLLLRYLQPLLNKLSPPV